MRVTRENVQGLIDNIDSVIETLEEIRDNGQTWIDLQDETRTPDINDEIRDARESLNDALATLKDYGVTL